MAAWLLIAVFVIISIITGVSSDCVWYDHCGKNPKEGKGNEIVNCKYDGHPKPLTDPRAIEILEDICPWVFSSDDHSSVTLCCSPANVFEMRKQLDQAIGLYSRCPQCLYTFFRFICETTCGGNQSKFMHVTQAVPYTPWPPEPGPQKEAVLEVNYYLTEQFAEGFYNACSGVLFPSTGLRVVEVMCQNAHFSAEECNANKFLQSTGNEDVPSVPFQVRHCYGNYDPVGNCGDWIPSQPLDAPVFPCSKKLEDVGYWPNESPCPCTDCPEVCQENNEKEQVGKCLIPFKEFEKDYFDQHFGPFYRVTQLIFRPLDYSTAEPYYVGLCSVDDDDGSGSYTELSQDDPDFYKNATGIFRKSFLDRIFQLQLDIMKLTAEYKGKTVRLDDVCFKPSSENSTSCTMQNVVDYFKNGQTTVEISPSEIKLDATKLIAEYKGKTVRIDDICFKPEKTTCTIQSVFNYFQNSPKKFTSECPATEMDPFPAVKTYMEKLRICLMDPIDESCLGNFGGPVFPWLVLDRRYGDSSDYETSKAILITIFLRNADNKNTKYDADAAGAARAWESALIDYLHNYMANVSQDVRDPGAFALNYNSNDNF